MNHGSRVTHPSSGVTWTANGLFSVNLPTVDLFTSHGLIVRTSYRCLSNDDTGLARLSCTSSGITALALTT